MFAELCGEANGVVCTKKVLDVSKVGTLASTWSTCQEGDGPREVHLQITMALIGVQHITTKPTLIDCAVRQLLGSTSWQACSHERHCGASQLQCTAEHQPQCERSCNLSLRYMAFGCHDTRRSGQAL